MVVQTCEGAGAAAAQAAHLPGEEEGLPRAAHGAVLVPARVQVGALLEARVRAVQQVGEHAAVVVLQQHLVRELRGLRHHDGAVDVVRRKDRAVLLRVLLVHAGRCRRP